MDTIKFALKCIYWIVALWFASIMVQATKVGYASLITLAMFGIVYYLVSISTRNLKALKTPK